MFYTPYCFRQESCNIYLKNARKFCLTMIGFATLLFFRWKIDWNWPFSCKIFQIWHISIFQPQHASKKNLPNLDSPCELVFPACSFPALRSLRTDPILGFHMPRIPLSWTQAAISQKNHFQVSNLVESATCPSSLCKNPELICCRTIRNSSSFLSTSTGFDQNQL